VDLQSWSEPFGKEEKSHAPKKIPAPDRPACPWLSLYTNYETSSATIYYILLINHGDVSKPLYYVFTK